MIKTAGSDATTWFQRLGGFDLRQIAHRSERHLIRISPVGDKFRVKGSQVLSIAGARAHCE
jgi:hypothetical protein